MMKKKPVKKMAKGGKTNMEMRQYGRNMAKVMNQKKGNKGGKVPK